MAQRLDSAVDGDALEASTASAETKRETSGGNVSCNWVNHSLSHLYASVWRQLRQFKSLQAFLLVSLRRKSNSTYSSDLTSAPSHLLDLALLQDFLNCVINAAKGFWSVRIRGTSGWHSAHIRHTRSPSHSTAGLNHPEKKTFHGADDQIIDTFIGFSANPARNIPGAGRSMWRFAALLLPMAAALTYRCRNDQVLVVQSFGNDTIRMHCQKLDLCGYQQLKCDYDELQPQCGGQMNFVSHVNQRTATSPVEHTCCNLYNPRPPHVIPTHTGNDCFIYELPDGSTDGKVVEKSAADDAPYAVLKSPSEIPEHIDNMSGYRLRLFLLKNKSPPTLLVKGIERRLDGYRVTICRPRCSSYDAIGQNTHNGEDEGEWKAISWSSWTSSSWSTWARHAFNGAAAASGAGAAGSGAGERVRVRTGSAEQPAGGQRSEHANKDDKDGLGNINVRINVDGKNNNSLNGGGDGKTSATAEGGATTSGRNGAGVTAAETSGHSGASAAASANNGGQGNINIHIHTAGEGERGNGASGAAGAAGGATAPIAIANASVNINGVQPSGSGGAGIPGTGPNSDKSGNKPVDAGKGENKGSVEESGKTPLDGNGVGEESNAHLGKKGGSWTDGDLIDEEDGEDGEKGKGKGKGDEGGSDDDDADMLKEKKKPEGGKGNGIEVNPDGEVEGEEANGADGLGRGKEAKGGSDKSAGGHQGEKDGGSNKNESAGGSGGAEDREPGLNGVGPSEGEKPGGLDGNNSGLGEAVTSGAGNGVGKGEGANGGDVKENGKSDPSTSSAGGSGLQPAPETQGRKIEEVEVATKSITESGKLPGDEDDDGVDVKDVEVKTKPLVGDGNLAPGSEGTSGIGGANGGDPTGSDKPAIDKTEETSGGLLTQEGKPTGAENTGDGIADKNEFAEAGLAGGGPSVPADAVVEAPAPGGANPGGTDGGAATGPAAGTSNQGATAAAGQPGAQAGAQPGTQAGTQTGAQPAAQATNAAGDDDGSVSVSDTAVNRANRLVANDEVGTQPLTQQARAAAAQPAAAAAADPAAAAADPPRSNCFAADTLVKTTTGEKRMDELNVGDFVLVPSAGSVLKYERVETFYHREPETRAVFVVLFTDSGRRIALTKRHLIPFAECDLMRSYASSEDGIEVAMREARYAEKAQKGDCVLSVDPRTGKVAADRIVRIGRQTSTGIYSPMTVEGSLVADGVLASCFSHLESHTLHKVVFDFMMVVYNFFGLISERPVSVQPIPNFVTFVQQLSSHVLPFS
ncbi:unnamed protein product [Caenorhabditis auriculariae]|uniref:Hint domain-containing protein n=1 Tax=Caenorhabditis auriculariae TaxID=2777116 RepID=A0A8S1HFX3_9PELO|nr:unnamed protein product [Caenorhabditis auriculariae]